VGFEGIINLCPLRAFCQKAFPASLNFSPEVSVGFITGIFLGIFVALVLEAIKSRRVIINRPES